MRNKKNHTIIFRVSLKLVYKMCNMSSISRYRKVVQCFDQKLKFQRTENHNFISETEQKDQEKAFLAFYGVPNSTVIQCHFFGIIEPHLEQFKQGIIIISRTLLFTQVNGINRQNLIITALIFCGPLLWQITVVPETVLDPFGFEYQYP